MAPLRWKSQLMYDSQEDALTCQDPTHANLLRGISRHEERRGAIHTAGWRSGFMMPPHLPALQGLLLPLLLG